MICKMKLANYEVISFFFIKILSGADGNALIYKDKMMIG